MAEKQGKSRGRKVLSFGGWNGEGRRWGQGLSCGQEEKNQCDIKAWCWAPPVPHGSVGFDPPKGYNGRERQDQLGPRERPGGRVQGGLG